MFSIIVCSINPEKLNILKTNISESADGIPFEIIAFDNRESALPIAAVYNKCASEAKYPNLLFVHEDAGFVTKGWGESIAGKLAEENCGVIGFAGSRLMLDAPGGWNVMPEWCVWNFREKGVFKNLNVGIDSTFEEVVAVDGFAMFVRKTVWEEFPFDETILTGFHCYDVDFSLSVGQKYTNYVCCDVLLYHDSEGNFGADWTRESWKLYSKKWNAMLPMYVKGLSLTPKERVYYEERLYFRFIKSMRNHGMDYSKLMEKFVKFPLSFRHLEHLLKLKSFKQFLKVYNFSLWLMKEK